MALLGIGMAGIWAPLAATATRNLPMQLAGAGSGVYNATRQVGAVLGSAAIAVLIDARHRRARALRRRRARAARSSSCPRSCARPFSAAMSDTLLLPVGRAAARLRLRAVLPAPAPPDARRPRRGPAAAEAPARRRRPRLTPTTLPRAAAPCPRARL